MIVSTTRTRRMDSTEGASSTQRWNIVSCHQFHHYSRCNLISSTAC